MINRSSGTSVVIEGIDGSGKSTTAQEAARILSEAYTSLSVGVTDSTGLHTYARGGLVEHSYEWLEGMEPLDKHGPLQTIARLGGFTLARRFVDSRGRSQSDVLLSVRDPHRVDPAVYSASYSQRIFGRLSPEARLRFFDKFSLAGHPDMVIQLDVDPAAARITPDRTGSIGRHEASNSLELVAKELPQVISAYGRLFRKPVHAIEALRTNTTQEVARRIEPLVAAVSRAA